MNSLSINRMQTSQTLDSREAAEMMEKRHDNLVRDIDGYVAILASSELRGPPDSKVDDYFIESTYDDAQGKTRRCHLITCKGCEMIAHKMTGEKGVRFTAAYIDRFHEMESNQFANLSPELQYLISVDLRLTKAEEANQRINEQVDGMRNIIALNPTQWRKDGSDIIKKIAHNMGGYEYIKVVHNEVYDLLEQRFGVNLGTRLTYKRRRMAEEGVSKSRRDKLNQLDVIAEDKKLIEGYVAIVKELAIKYGVGA